MPSHRAGEQQIGNNGQHPNDVLCADIYYVGIDEDGYSNTLDFACFFTRAINSIPLQGIPDSEAVADVLLSQVIANMGTPSEIRVDQGSNLISKAIQILYERMGIKLVVGTAYHHQLVALVERWHRTLGQLIKTHRAATVKHGWGSKWYRCLPLMQLAYNSTINPSTRYSPFFLQHLRHARLPTDYKRAELPELPKQLADWVQCRLDDLNVVYDAATRSLRLNAISAKRKYDLRHDVGLWFKAGDRVLLTKGAATDKGAIQPKAEIPNEGPYTVQRALPYDRYSLTDLKTRQFRDTVHVSRLLPYFDKVPEDSSRWMIGNSPGDKTGGQWPVHSLVGRRTRVLEKRNDELGLPVGASVLEYKVRWVGWSPPSDRWRAVQYLSGIFELINEYDRHNPFTPGNARDILPTVDRPAEPTPIPTAQAQNRKHYRARLNPGPAPSLEDRQQGPIVLPQTEELEVNPQSMGESIEDARQRLQGSLNRLPVNTRVRVYYPKEDQWWPGTVSKSWLPRWKTVGKKSAHHIWVLYDDPRYPEPFEHNVQESIVETLEQGTSKTRSDAGTEPLDLDEGARKRLLRLERQLSKT